MDTFRAHHADILDPAQEPRVLALLREHGLVTFTGITDRTALAGVARRLMSIRPHRDAGPDGVTVITDTGTTGPGYAAFTDAELIPHTDGTSLPDPPGLLLLTCQRPASQGRHYAAHRRCPHHRHARRAAPRRPPGALRATSRLLRHRGRPPRPGLRTRRPRAGTHPAPPRRPGHVLRRRHPRHPDPARRDHPAPAGHPAPCRPGPAGQQLPLAARPRPLHRPSQHAPYPG